jgi:hypothetical protein
VSDAGLAPGVTDVCESAMVVNGDVVIPVSVTGSVTAPPTGVTVKLNVAVCPARTVIVPFGLVNVNEEIIVTSDAVSFARFTSPPPETAA